MGKPRRNTNNNEPRHHPRYRLHKFIQSIPFFTGVNWLAWVVFVGSLTTGTAATLFLALLRFCQPNPDSYPKIVNAACAWVHSNQLMIAVVLLALQTIAAAVSSTTRRFVSRLKLTQIERLLNQCVTQMFENRTGDHVYRATLFTVRAFPMCGRWLAAVARSGHTYRRLRAVFSIDTEKRSNNTGYAGECWRQAGQTLVCPEELPDIRTQPADPEALKQYARAGFLAEEELSTMAVKSRVFLAMGIRVRGQLWGILVLDSTDPSTMSSVRNAMRRKLLVSFAAESLSAAIEAG